MALIDWLGKIAPVVVAIEEDLGLDALKSAVPGIGLLVGVAKWAQKKGATPKAIKELCEKHDIVAEEVSSLEELKERVGEKGVDLSLSRLKAKVDFPSLVHYMESSRQVVEDRLNEFLDHFAALHEELREQYTLLTPAEIVLEDPPEDSESATPLFFRKTGPIAADIGSGKVVIRPKAEEIFKDLEDKRKSPVLLYGAVATGKTVMTRVLAYRWLKAARKVRFLQLKSDLGIIAFSELLEQTEKFGIEEPEPLLVIEDAHLGADLINNLLRRRKSGWPRILLTSRIAVPDLSSKETDNYFRRIHTKIELDPFDPVNEIVSMFFQHKGWELSETIEKEVTSISKGSLWLLSYALVSLEKTDGQQIHRGAILEKVQEDLEKLEGKNSVYPRLLIALSLLSRYEIPTDERFLRKRFEKANWPLGNALLELTRMGELIQGKQNSYRLFALPHSALADLCFHFTYQSTWEEQSIYGDPDNFIHDYSGSALAVNCLTLFSRSELTLSTAELDMEALGQRISDTDDLWSAAACIVTVFDADPEACKELVSNISMEALGQRILETDNLWSAVTCIGKVFDADPEACKELVSNISMEALGQRILETDDLWSAAACIGEVFDADPEACKELMSNISMEALGQRISDTDKLWGPGEFIGGVFEADPEACKELVSNISMEALGQRISDTDNPRGAGVFIGELFKADPEACKELMSNISMEALGQRILETDDLLGAGWFIGELFKADSEACKELVSNISMEALGQRISDTDNLWGAGVCIVTVFEADPEACKELMSNISMEALGQRISETDDLRGAGWFIGELFKADPEVAKEMARHISKERFAELRGSGLYKVLDQLEAM